MTDDWRLSGLTLNLGVRWEYEAPFTEADGRLASPLRPDRRGLEPRLAASWRPVLGSSLVIRASYGLYRNLGVYQPLALLLTQQPPFARTFSVENSPQDALTLANPFPASVSSTNTFAVDPDFRAGYAHTWQVSAQRDLPASLTMIVAYLGAKGSHLMQASCRTPIRPGRRFRAPPARRALFTSARMELAQERRTVHDPPPAS